MNLLRRFLQAIACAFVASSAFAADGAGDVPTANGAVGVTIVEPRAFGYVVGDLMTRQVTVTMAFTSVPPSGRNSFW